MSLDISDVAMKKLEKERARLQPHNKVSDKTNKAIVATYPKDHTNAKKWKVVPEDQTSKGVHKEVELTTIPPTKVPRTATIT